MQSLKNSIIVVAVLALVVSIGLLSGRGSGWWLSNSVHAAPESSDVIPIQQTQNVTTNQVGFNAGNAHEEVTGAFMHFSYPAGSTIPPGLTPSVNITWITGGVLSSMTVPITMIAAEEGVVNLPNMQIFPDPETDVTYTNQNVPPGTVTDLSQEALKSGDLNSLTRK
jgi:hypothetical protein